QEDLPQASDIALDSRRHFTLEQTGDVQVLFGGAVADEVQRRLHTVTEIERLYLDVHVPRFDFRKVENVIDDREQCFAGIADSAGIVPLLLTEPSIQQKTAHTDDGIHRLADFV